MARRPEPLERKVLKARGDGKTPGGREIVKANPTLVRHEVMVPDVPRGLSTRGKLEWRKIWETGFWLNVSQDYHWVEMIARAYDDIAAFRKRVNEDGLIQVGSLGQPVAHPLIAEIRKCEATIRTCLSVLGFSPTDRARLGIMEAVARKKTADLKEFLDRQKDRIGTSDS
jgi:P27 family predicted phage terminase small subunit